MSDFLLFSSTGVESPIIYEIDYFINTFPAHDDLPNCRHAAVNYRKRSGHPAALHSLGSYTLGVAHTPKNKRRRLLINETRRMKPQKFNLKMKEAISCVTEAPGGRLGLCARVCLLGSQRSDAGMPHLLDNPICPVINHTHYWRRDGSSPIKASRIPPRGVAPNTQPPRISACLFIIRSHPDWRSPGAKF